jgi:hypothetical protein
VGPQNVRSMYEVVIGEDGEWYSLDLMMFVVRNGCAELRLCYEHMGMDYVVVVVLVGWLVEECCCCCMWVVECIVAVVELDVVVAVDCVVVDIVDCLNVDVVDCLIVDRVDNYCCVDWIVDLIVDWIVDLIVDWIVDFVVVVFAVYYKSVCIYHNGWRLCTLAFLNHVQSPKVIVHPYSLICH